MSLSRLDSPPPPPYRSLSLSLSTLSRDTTQGLGGKKAGTGHDQLQHGQDNESFVFVVVYVRTLDARVLAICRPASECIMHLQQCNYIIQYEY